MARTRYTDRARSRAAIVGLALVASTLLAACSAASTTPTQLGGSKASLDGLPVPVQASSFSQGGDPATYSVPASLATLDDWYRRHLAVGKPWRGWAWYSAAGPHCLNLFSGTGLSWHWSHGSSVLTLSTSPTNNPDRSAIDVAILPQHFSCQTGQF